MAEPTDLPTHTRTYDRMIGTLKWSAIVVGVITALIIWLIA